MSRSFPNGVGESLGDQLVTNAPLFVSGGIWHVDSTNADAADASGYGLIKDKPWATLVYAVSQAAAGDMIVLHDGHDETINGLNITSRLIIVGAGQSDGKPTVRLRLGTSEGSGACLQLSASATELRNIWFDQNVGGTGNLTFWVQVSATGCRLFGNYFEGDENNNSPLLYIDDALVTILERNTFISVATDVADQPRGALAIAGGILFMDGDVFDGNQVGWGGGSYPAAFESEAAATIVAENLSLLRSSRMLITEASGQHIINVATSTGDSQIIEQ